MNPLVSIITPSYNQARFIRYTIESILSQDYDNIEYIIIDGGSTDGTLEILKEYKDKLIYISEKDNGQSDAINKGFRMAKGEIVAWLNSDDTYEPGCVSKAVKEFKHNKKLGLLYGDGYITDENNNKIKLFEYTQEFDLWKLVNFWDYIMQPATFFRANYLKQVDYLDDNLHYCMDWDLWIKLAIVSEVKYIKEILACSREYEETKTSTGGTVRLKEIISLLQKYSEKNQPLGVYSYKASTRYNKYAKGKFTKKIMSKYLNKTHEILNNKMPVRYPDGWIGKKYEMLIPSYKKQVFFDIDTTNTQVFPINVIFLLNNKVVNKKYYEGPTIEKIEILLEDNERKLNNIMIKCDKTFTIPSDDRKLSIKIH